MLATDLFTGPFPQLLYGNKIKMGQSHVGN